MSEAKGGRYSDLPYGPSVLDNVVRKLRRVLDCEGASVLLSSGDRPLAYPCAASDGVVGPFRKGHTVCASQTPLIPGRRGWVLVEDGGGPNTLQELAWTSELRSSLWLAIGDQGGESVGALALFDRRPARFTGEEAPLLELISDQIRDILNLYARIGDVIVLDEHTGLRSAAYGRKQLAEEVERSARYGSVLSAVVVRVDGLSVAPGGGDARARDELLRRMGEAVDQTIRASDQSAVLTEQSFLIVAPETDAAGALSVTARLIECVREMLPAGSYHAVSGGTATTASGTATPDDLIVTASRNARRCLGTHDTA